ncbi:maleylpyruvate isomerase N-terminal domain-containing protein [Paractinoplanes toevensis]|uniref:maleylpyruvate isomerase N-terminal domain-containing protein n=1 Tax=Paractinoplanes toevensis TaxID=571911 RepID=UPI001BB445C1|nr:maleylpyruvate isomerase N-terminal domain-containing protein [Actinoplanes toevensis]
MRERTGLDRGPEVLQQAMALLRARFIDLLAQLSEAEWERPSRCAAWSVHDVARHVRDCALTHTALLAHRPPPLGKAPFDPRSSPFEWLRHSAGTPTTQTMDDQGVLCLTGTASYPTIGMLAGLTGGAFPSRLRP